MNRVWPIRNDSSHDKGRRFWRSRGVVSLAAQSSRFSWPQYPGDFGRRTCRIWPRTCIVAIVAFEGYFFFLSAVKFCLNCFSKTRVMTDPSMREVTRTPLQQVIEGSKLGARVVMQREIFKGSLVFASKRFADWTTRFECVLDSFSLFNFCSCV